MLILIFNALMFSSFYYPPHITIIHQPQIVFTGK
jgi:hypothetical protein